MSLFKQNSARHRAETTSHAVRNTTIAAAAGAAVIGSIAPAQAYAQAPVQSGAAYSAPASASLAGYTSYTYQAPVAAQSAPSAYQAPAPQQATTAASSVTTQSNKTTAISPAAGGVVGTAHQGIGSAYVYGGTAFGAWDCSGFTQWVFAQHGIDLPRTTWAQFAAATPTSNPQPGDLVSQNGGGHVGIYIGGGKMISALNPAQGTQIHSVNAMQLDGYYSI